MKSSFLQIPSFSFLTGLRRTRLPILLGLLLATVLLSACKAGDFAEIPAGKAYVDGKEIYFAHTEVSDPGVAELLSNMMKSPVVAVPSLALIPDEALAEVYVFTNGIAGSGPLDFQADVFTNQPGDEGYSPLRKIIFATWTEGSQPKLLTSAADIENLAASGALTLERSNIVVNMPFMAWTGGQR